MLQSARGKCFEKGLGAATSPGRRSPISAPENQFRLKMKKH
jgi:hypothetical protein